MLQRFGFVAKTDVFFFFVFFDEDDNSAAPYRRVFFGRNSFQRSRSNNVKKRRVRGEEEKKIPMDKFQERVEFYCTRMYSNKKFHFSHAKSIVIRRTFIV